MKSIEEKRIDEARALLERLRSVNPERLPVVVKWLRPLVASEEAVARTLDRAVMVIAGSWPRTH